MADPRDLGRERPSGSKFASLAIGGIATAFFAFLPFVIVVLVYLALSVYALVVAIGHGGAPNPVTVLVTVVLLVSVLALAFAGTVVLVGRSLTPKRRRRDRS
jgi:hypothetical protein